VRIPASLDCEFALGKSFCSADGCVPFQKCECGLERIEAMESADRSKHCPCSRPTEFVMYTHQPRAQRCEVACDARTESNFACFPTGVASDAHIHLRRLNAAKDVIDFKNSEDAQRKIKNSFGVALHIACASLVSGAIF
jgi:hypothetical protein